MENFKLEGRRIQNYTIEQISEEYQELLRKYQRRFFNQIIDIVQYEIRGISESRMEEWIDDYLVSEIKSYTNKQIDRFGMSIEENFEILSKNINNGQKVDSSFNQYLEDLKILVNKENLTDLDEITDIFVRQFIRKIENYYDAFYGISDNNFSRALENIQENLKIQLRKINQQFVEEYREIIKKYIVKNAKRTKENIDVLTKQEDKISEEQIVRISKILEYNNYELIQDNNKLYITEKESEQVLELMYDKQNRVFYTKDRNIGIKLTDGYMISIDKKKNTTMLDDGISLEIGSIDRKNIIKISQGLTGHEFYINNKKVSTNQEMLAVIEIIKQKSPAYYNKLLKSKEFLEILESMNKKETQNVEKILTPEVLAEQTQLSASITGNNEENLTQRRK